MNILFASDIYYPTLGGISVAAWQLSHALGDRGHTVSIIAPAHGFHMQKTIEGNVTTYLMPAISIMKKKGIYLAINPFAISKLVATLQPDVIHVMTVGPATIRPAAVKTARKLGIPVVVGMHVVPENLTASMHLPKKIDRSLENILRRRILTIAQSADAVVFPTTAAANLFPELKTLPTVSVISNGLSHTRFQIKNQTQVDTLKKRFSLPEKSTIILYTGRLDADKKVHLLIEALPTILREHNAHLLIIGKGENAEQLKLRANELKITSNITFGGFIEEELLPAVYQLATVYVMPSDVELQSISTMEAMASGLPIVGANAAALPLLIHDNKNGYLFNPNDSSDLATKLTHILSDQQSTHSMGKMSLEYIKEHTMEQVVRRFEDVYSKVISQK